jgi:photosystem II stability/assembly factor-like uncharacterized protein
VISTRRFVAASCALAALATAVLAGAAPALAAPAWHAQSLSAAPALAGVDFVDASHGWTVGRYGEIRATSNGGRTWEGQNSGTGGDLYAVDFVDLNHGWAVGSSGLIIATSDGGATWTGQTSGTAENITDVSFVDVNHGFAIAGETVLKTSDGGATWSPATALPSFGEAIAFSDATHGVAFAPAGPFSTADGGSSWTPHGGTSALYEGAVVGNTHAWGVGPGGAIDATSDGSAWAAQSSGTSTQLNAVSFADLTHGWVVGQGGTILATSDGGEHWQSQSSSTADSLTSVSAPSASNAYAVSENGTFDAYYDAAAASAFEVSAPASAKVGEPVSFTVTALTSAGQVASEFGGTVHFTSSDGAAVLPADATLTNGTGTFSATLKSAGSRTITATSGAVTGTSGSIAVAKATPTISTTPSGSVAIGGTVSDEATVSGRVNPQEGASVTFNLFAPADTSCTGVPVFTSTVAYAAAATNVASGSFTPTAPGTYRWTAAYTGDANNEAKTSGCGSETVTVGLATPGLAGQASPGGTAGEAIHDTATLSGAFAPTGTVTFWLYGPEDGTCSGPALAESTATVSGNGSYESAAVSPAIAGEYQWVAEYSGDSNNGPAGTACGEPEQGVTVAKAASATTLAASPNPAASGAKVILTATVSGYQPGGSVTFMDGATALGSAPLGSAVKATLEVAGLSSGSHSLSARYAGDGANLASVSAAVDEVVEAPPVPPAPQPAFPSVTVTYSPNHPHSPNPKGGPRYTFHFGDAAAGVSFQCRLDGGPWHPCSSPTVRRHLKPGRHVFRVKSIDAAGRESAVQTVKFVAGRRPR